MFTANAVNDRFALRNILKWSPAYSGTDFASENCENPSVLRPAYLMKEEIQSSGIGPAMNNSFPIRVGVNAVVVSDNRLLTVQFDDETGPHYNLPGGGVDRGERIPDALTREVQEETTADVLVGQLLFVHEYYPPDHEGKLGPTHKLTLFFECELVDPATPSLPANPDSNQIGVEWLPLETIEEQPLLPKLGHEWNVIVGSEPSERYLDSG